MLLSSKIFVVIEFFLVLPEKVWEKLYSKRTSKKPAEVPAYVTDGTFWNISKRPMRPGEVRFPISTIDPANTQYDVCTKQLRCMPTDGDYIEKVNSVSPGIHTIIRYLMAFWWSAVPRPTFYLVVAVARTLQSVYSRTNERRFPANARSSLLRARKRRRP